MSIPAGQLPILVLKNTVLFPGITQTLRVGREKSLKAVDSAAQKNNWIITVAQKDATSTTENQNDLFQIGTLSKIESIKSADDKYGYFIIVRAYYRVKLTGVNLSDGCFMGFAEQINDVNDIDSSIEQSLTTNMKSISKECLELLPHNTDQLQELINGIDDISLLNHTIAHSFDLPIHEKQNILENTSIRQRSLFLLDRLSQLKQSLQVQHDIQQKLSDKIGRSHKEHILREQLKTIKAELGEADEDSSIEDLKNKINTIALPQEAKKLALQQLKKLENSNAQSPEYQITRSHLELLISLPWAKSSETTEIDLDKAEQILNDDHYGLTKIKKRILQHLSVLKLKNDKKGSILLFVGPPGVGKTSLGQSIAKALGRKYHRISLGGLRDESEIRGHRRTYIGALPGRFISAYKKAGENDPVIVLDEIDKMSRSFSGDPASALLEVLDPEQNTTFMDHYLDTSFDLSKTFFVATANSLEGIPLPLLDRMEIIDLNGYTLNEKLNIAKKHLIPKQLENHGIENRHLKITDEAVIRLISHYTREAGVRKLNQRLAEICRYQAEKIIRSTQAITVEIGDLESILGPEVYSSEFVDIQAQPGVVTGLAWTPVGGDILFIETALVPGKGDMIITGQLGDVMRESAQIAKSLIKARMAQLAPLFDFNKFDIHLHVPSGAIPKDGPSAGITLLTSLASLVSRKVVSPYLAMTGEITLRGKVMPVGGIKEKVIAAHRAGINEVILCSQNKKDLIDVPEEILDSLKIHYVDNINQVLSIALEVNLFDWKDEYVYTQSHLIPYTSTDA